MEAKLKIKGIIAMILFCLIPIKSFALKNWTIYHNAQCTTKNYLLKNETHISWELYDSFRKFLDTSYFCNNSNVFSRLSATDRKTGKEIFNIGMIPCSDIIFESNKIICVSKYSVFGAPQIAIVDLTGKIIYIGIIPVFSRFFNEGKFDSIKFQYPNQIQLLNQYQAIQFRHDTVEIDFEKVKSIGNYKFIDAMEDKLIVNYEYTDTTKDYLDWLASAPAPAIIMHNTEIGHSRTDHGHIYWYTEEKNPKFKLKYNFWTKNYSLCFIDYYGDRRKLKLYKPICG